MQIDYGYKPLPPEKMVRYIIDLHNEAKNDYQSVKNASESFDEYACNYIITHVKKAIAYNDFYKALIYQTILSLVHERHSHIVKFIDVAALRTLTHLTLEEATEIQSLIPNA